MSGGLREAVREQVVLRQDHGDVQGEQEDGAVRLAVEAAEAQEEAEAAEEADAEARGKEQGAAAEAEEAGEEQKEAQTQQAQ